MNERPPRLRNPGSTWSDSTDMRGRLQVRSSSFISSFFYRESGTDGRPACGSRASLALRSVFSTLQRLAPLQSHNSHLALLKQMTLRALRCDGRVPRKSRYSRSGKPPLLDRRPRGRDRGFPEEQSGLFSHPSSLTDRRRRIAGKNVRDSGSPRGSPRANTLETAGSTREGCSKMLGCKAPEILSHESYPFRYVEWRRMRETPQTGVFQQPVQENGRDGGTPPWQPPRPDRTGDLRLKFEKR